MSEQEKTVLVGGEYLNVAEAFTLTDTVLISDHVTALSTPVPGWFSTWALAGAANKWPFFNVRNRAICDLAWNNQDTRDTAAFGMRIKSCSVRFFGPMHGDPAEIIGTTPYFIDHYEAGPIWESFIPFNAALVLRVQQDEKLKANCAMLNSGAGIVMGGFGEGGIAADWVPANSVVAYGNQGEPHQKNKFGFPEVIDIPTRASVSCDIILSDYARSLLQHQTGPGQIIFSNSIQPASTDAYPAVFGVQVELKGQRLVQQRGQLHA